MLKSFLKLPSKVQDHDLVRFCKSLGILLRAGVSLDQALSVLKHQFSGKLNIICQQIEKDIIEGRSLTDSLALHKVFPATLLHLCTTGEATAGLDNAFLQAAEYLEEKAKFSSNIKSALAYPIIVMSLSVATLVALMIFVLPVFESLYFSMDVKLPPLTLFLLWVSKSLRGFGIFAIGIVFLLVIYFGHKLKQKDPARFEALIFSIPFVGKFLAWQKLQDICHCLSVLLEAGLPLTDSLNILKKNFNSCLYRNKLGETEELLHNGTSLSEAGKACGLFDQTCYALVTIGEQSGQLAQMFKEAAIFYRFQVDRVIKGFFKILEPAVTLCVGGIVMLVAAAMLLPIVNLVSNLSK